MDDVTAFDLEVARHRFTAVADEMGSVLRRTGYSPNIKERADFSTALFVASGEMLAQAEHIPVHLGSMPASVRAVIDEFGESLELDAQYAVNDPYHGGTHLNDLTLVRPVSIAGDLVGWIANRAHHADVGGDAPGSMPAGATRLEQEGHVVAPCLAARAGEWAPPFLDPFLAATRTPAERVGDLSAQLGANEIGARRLADLCALYGPAAFSTITNGLLDYGERLTRAAISALPDGTYQFEDHVEGMDADGGGRLHRICVEVTIDGGELHADFTGSADQVDTNFNSVEAVAVSCLYYAVRVATDPSIPANGGCYRPVSMSAPAGTIVAALPPAAVAAGNVETSQRIADVLLGALAQANPSRVPAASQGTMNNVLIGSDEFAYYETIGGGQGARPGKAGQSGIHTGMTNTKNTPIESLTQHYPIKVTAYGLRRGSAGRGADDGGEGIVRELEFLAPATVTLMCERRRTRPWGLAGGGPGAPGEDWVLRAGGAPERLPGKTTFEVEPGDRLRILTPGGGGWGR
jgi:N-methylhydantoinase B